MIHHVLVSTVSFYQTHVGPIQNLNVIAQGTWNLLPDIRRPGVVVQGAFLDVLGKAGLAERVQTRERFRFREEVAADGTSQLLFEPSQRFAACSHFNFVLNLLALLACRTQPDVATVIP
jgi:hypothetical protein